jgi:hypothetical protein
MSAINVIASPYLVFFKISFFSSDFLLPSTHPHAATIVHV